MFSRYRSPDCIAVAAALLGLACGGCERAGESSAAPAEDADRAPVSRITLEQGDGDRPDVRGQWRMRRGRLSDFYHLVRKDGTLRGEVDAAGIGEGIEVSGSVEGEVVKLSWQAAGKSSISEDGSAQYEFRFEGRLVPQGIEGRAVLVGHHLAKGGRVPVEESFAARMDAVLPGAGEILQEEP